MASQNKLPTGDQLRQLHDEIDEAINQSTYSVADYTFGSLCQLIESGAIDIGPEYQRGDVWGVAEQSKWIESALMGIPLPPIFLFKRPRVRDKTSVIDGKQRLTAIFKFMDLAKGFRLTKLNKLHQLSRLTYKDLFDINIAAHLDQISIRTFTLKNQDIGMISEVFQRLNSGGIQLNEQEIRKAIFFDAPFTTVLKAVANDKEFCSMTKMNPEKIERMLNQEYALRYFAFRRDRHKGFVHDVDEFLTGAYSEMAAVDSIAAEEAGAEFIQTVRATKAALDDFAFRSITTKGKVSHSVSNTLLDATLSAFDVKSVEACKAASKKIQEAYRASWSDTQFRHLFSGPGTNTKQKALDRIDAMKRIADLAG